MTSLNNKNEFKYDKNNKSSGFKLILLCFFCFGDN